MSGDNKQAAQGSLATQLMEAQRLFTQAESDAGF